MLIYKAQIATNLIAGTEPVDAAAVRVPPATQVLAVRAAEDIAVASAEPPGGKPTKIFTGAACAKLGIAIVAVAALSRPRAWRRRINGDMRFS